MITPDIVVAEVQRLHGFFDDWFAGREGRTIGEFSDALDDAFTMVGPDGAVMSRAEIVTTVEKRFGVGGTAVTVENFHVRRLGGVFLCRYEEVQVLSRRHRTRRVSTAVFTPEASAPGGLAWVAVHETFISA